MVNSFGSICPQSLCTPLVLLSWLFRDTGWVILFVLCSEPGAFWFSRSVYAGYGCISVTCLWLGAFFGGFFFFAVLDYFNPSYFTNKEGYLSLSASPINWKRGQKILLYFSSTHYVFLWELNMSWAFLGNTGVEHWLCIDCTKTSMHTCITAYL